MSTQAQEMVNRNEAPSITEASTEDVRAERRVAPLVDVYENTDELLLYVDVPGVDQDGLDIRLEKGQLDLEARQAPQGDWHRPVVFARSFTVPNSIDAEKVSAELEMGRLVVHLPKSEAAKPRRIEVKLS